MTDPAPPPRAKTTRLRTAVLLVVFAGLVGAWGMVARRCTGAVRRAAESLDALRTDRTWRDSYRGLAAQDVDALRASLLAAADPARHPRMGRGVVLRGRVGRVDLAAQPDPSLVLEGDSGAVRCHFDARRSDRLAALRPGAPIVIGGALAAVDRGIPVLVACHFEDEWADG